MSDDYDKPDYSPVHNELLSRMKSLLSRIYTECDERDGGGDARFSAELYEELRRFVKEMQK